MGDNVFVSVIMPVLNGMPYFEQAINSVCNQSLKEIEIIIVDAGSTDGTVEYVDKCMKKDCRIKLLSSSKKSMGEQYNIGISNAKGMYVAFCESDDYLAQEMLHDLFYAAEIHDYPDTVKSDFYMFFGSDPEVSLHYHIFPKKQNHFYGKVICLSDYIELFNRDVNMWNGIFNRGFLVKNEIMLNGSSGAAFQDTGFVQQVNLLAQRQLYLSEPYYHYRRDNDGSSVYAKETSAFAMQECRFMMKWFEKHLPLKKKYGNIFLERMISLFLTLYSKNKIFNDKLSFEENITSFRNEVIDFCEDISSAAKTRLYQNDRLYAFLETEFDFEIAPKMHLKKEIELLKILKKEVDRYNRVVIFGVGEIGQSICAFLKKNRYEGELFFCDNNPDFRGTTVLGCKVKSVEDTVNQYDDALYIVNPNMLYDMEYQLLGCGVPCKRIVVPPVISPHLSMELNWDFRKRKEE